jgi:hypothetical protein
LLASLLRSDFIKHLLSDFRPEFTVLPIAIRRWLESSVIPSGLVDLSTIYPLGSVIQPQDGLMLSIELNTLCVRTGVCMGYRAQHDAARRDGDNDGTRALFLALNTALFSFGVPQIVIAND